MNDGAIAAQVRACYTMGVRLRVVARPAIALERPSRDGDGLVVYELEHAHRDETTHVLFEPLDFIARRGVRGTFGQALRLSAHRDRYLAYGQFGALFVRRRCELMDPAHREHLTEYHTLSLHYRSMFAITTHLETPYGSVSV